MDGPEIYDTSQIAHIETNETYFDLATDAPLKYFSPIMLMLNVPQVNRLVFMAFASIFGTIINGFFVAAFFIQNDLRTPGQSLEQGSKCKDMEAFLDLGNVYLCCTGVADFLITAIVMSSSAVILMSGEWDTPEVCRVLQIIAETATYAYSMFFVFVALENYLRACGTNAQYRQFLNLRLIYLPLILFGLCSGLSIFGVLLKYDEDYCERQYRSNINFRVTTMMFFHIIPALIIINSLCSALRTVNSYAKTHPQYKRSHAFRHHRKTFTLNLIVYFVYVASWIPYFIVVLGRNDNDEHYYYSVWLGLLRSLLSSLIYPAGDSEFRHAFKQLYNYCFCRNTLAGAYIRRHHRTARRRNTGFNMTVQYGQRVRPISLQSRPPTYETHSL